MSEAAMKLGEMNLILLPVDQLRPNPWNANEMDREMFEKERASIRKHGFFDPVLVREKEGETPYEIVDGFHRWTACQMEGHTHVPAVNLGAIPDRRAKEISVLANELRGRAEPVKLARLITEIVEGQDVAELLRTLPYRAAEVESMVQSIRTFDWTEAGSQRKERGSNDSNGRDDRTFQLGNLKGEIPADLCDALLAAYNATADSENSRTPEIVLRAWLRSLAPVPKP